MFAGYIIFGLFVMSFIENSLPANCPQGLSYHPAFGACYGVAAGGFSGSQDSAEKYCQSFGGHLPAIHSFEEFQHIQSYAYMAGDNVWTGITTLDGKTFYSNDKTDVSSFMNNSTMDWCFGGFSQTLDDRCIVVGEAYGLKCIFDTDCYTTQMHTVCKKAVDCLDQNGNPQIFPEDSWITNNCTVYNTCWKGKHVVRELPYECDVQEKCVLKNGNEMCQSPKCEEGWRFFTNTSSCYKVYHNVNAIVAEWQCLSTDGGHLTSIHSPEENNFIKRMIQIGSSDVGLEDQTLLGANITYPNQILKVSWLDGTRFDYSDGMTWPNQHGLQNITALAMLSDNPPEIQKSQWFFLKNTTILRNAICKGPIKPRIYF